mmetsp:Transcript_1739/g.3778  ORF Transcript_1739/g.3778 Transcript_1739/m.3778 type:complete len:609 (+) Transcript_1739:216-2042(+)
MGNLFSQAVIDGRAMDTNELADLVGPAAGKVAALANFNVSNITRPHVHKPKRPYIRGVNIGGWLLAERFITPYLFALTTCHLEGKFCSYPDQASGPQDVNSPDYVACSDATLNCRPVRTSLSRLGRTRHAGDEARLDYPVSEYDILSTFTDKRIARQYMERHWDTFVTKKELHKLKRAGVTHLRVPFGYWVRGDIADGEPWVEGGWHYFKRLVGWCREIGLEVWADLHGAPGSENGFDNSGHYLRKDTCLGWSSSPDNVARTIDVVRDIAQALVDDDLLDVVTGFGLLNEPFPDCTAGVLRKYYNDGLEVVREVIGPETAVFISDSFHADKWNDGFWTDPETHSNTFLDTHPYHVFFEAGRAFSPRQHIEYVCQYNTRDVLNCCYEDAPNNTKVSRGISRIIGEWSAAVDTLPTELETAIMNHIASNGTALMLDRELSRDRKHFLRNFVEAQMVAYEEAAVGTSSGHIFWNFKMEGRAFLEWDFLTGIAEGWIPHVPDPMVSSVDLFGSCYDIIYRTNDSYALIDEYPNPKDLDWNAWQGWSVDDDFVVNDGKIVIHHRMKPFTIAMLTIVVLLSLVGFRRAWAQRKRRQGYREVVSQISMPKAMIFG